MDGAFANTAAARLFNDAHSGDWDRRRRHWVRARTLINLRWAAIFGQTGAILAAQYGLGFRLPLGPCAALLFLLIWFNVAAAATMAPSRRLPERTALLWILSDVAQLWAMLSLTGGLTNPFALLTLAPATVAAATLSPRSAAAATTLACIAAMMQWSMPLLGPDGPVTPPQIYMLGMAAALTTGVTFTAFYVWRVASEGFRMSDALAATQMALAREQRLAALGAMAAAAAHELGTPLATIALTAREMELDLRDRPDLAADMALVREQTSRCREILAEFARQRKSEDAHTQTAPLSAIVEEAAAPLKGYAKRIHLAVSAPEGGQAAVPTVPRRPEIVQGLRNFIQNAADFARSAVWIDILLTDNHVSIVIEDDGPGFATETIGSLGEPFISTRERGKGAAQRNAGTGALSTEYEGMGLGVFIAKTLLERCGAAVVFANNPQGAAAERGGGAVVEITWRRRDLTGAGAMRDLGL